MSIPTSNISPEEMRLRNCIANLAGGISVSLAGDEKSTSFETDGEALVEPAIELQFSIEGKKIAIQLANSLLTVQQLTDHGVVDFLALPDSMRQLLTERAVAADLDRFELWNGCSLDSASSLSADIVIPFQISSTRGAILAEAGAADILRGIFEKLPQAKPDLSSQMINLPIELGRSRLSADELRNLESRDVVLIENGPDILKNAVEIRPSPNTLLKAALTETEIAIQEIIAMNPEDEPEEPENESNHPGEKLNVGDVPIELIFEIGRQQISLSELEKIQPGSTLPLEQPLENALVTIRANGKSIGTGELVQVGDQVGVQLN